MIERFLTSKARIKILGFLFFQKQETYLREIAKMLKLHISAVKREIDNLLETNIICKDGNKIMLNKKSNILLDLKNLLIKTDYIYLPIKEVLEKEKNINFAFIFGSIAKGDFRVDSDVDIMIIGEIKFSEVTELFRPIEEKIKREINPVVWNKDFLLKNICSSFFIDVMNKKKMFIKGDENELRKIIKR